AAAYEETARRIEEMMGVYWGGGLYLNYLFAILWTADVVCRWWNPVCSPPRRIQIAIQVYLAFIAFNASVIFGSGMIRRLGLRPSVLLLILFGLHYIWNKKSE